MAQRSTNLSYIEVCDIIRTHLNPGGPVTIRPNFITETSNAMTPMGPVPVLVQTLVGYTVIYEEPRLPPDTDKKLVDLWNGSPPTLPTPPPETPA